MIFAQTWQKVLDGKKRQTRRLKRGLYQLGHTYQVQPGRGLSSVGQIKITRIWCHELQRMGYTEVRAEGFANFLDFLETFCRLTKLSPEEAMQRQVWAFEFELVESG